MNDSCIFCKISNNEIPSSTIYEDREFKVILDRFPSSLGHTLIIPKIHAENIFELDCETGAKLFKLAITISNALKQSLKFDGLNLLQNNGAAAGQTVNHFHLHLIPRYKDDKIKIAWEAKDPSPGDFNKLLIQIKEYFSIDF